MAKQWTITHDERVQGWTSFHSYLPEWMLGMNNRFFTFRGGNLFLHHTQENARNRYYGQTFPTKVSVMINDAPSEIKFGKALSTEGNTKWDVVVTGYISSLEDFSRSTIMLNEFVKKEGIFYAHLRRNEIVTDRSSKSNYGIGIVESFQGATGLVLANSLPFSLAVGDVILNANEETVGTVALITQPNIIILASSPVNLSPNEFILGKKDSRTEGGEIRGYTVRVDLTNNESRRAELFAVNLEVAKSFA